jgi:hypothetical protein
VDTESEAELMAEDVGGGVVWIPFWIQRMQSLNLDCAARRRAWEVERCSRSDCRRCWSWESCWIGRVEMSTA